MQMHIHMYTHMHTHTYMRIDTQARKHTPHYCTFTYVAKPEKQETGDLEEEPVQMKKKKQFPGLAMPDDPNRAKLLLEPTADEKVAMDTLDQVRYPHL